jgi:hypothetical protein
MPTRRHHLHPWLARLAAIAAANVLPLLAATAALAQASPTSTTLPSPGTGARRINLAFILVAVGGAVLIVVMQRRASRKLRSMFQDEGDSQPDPPER